MEALIKAFANLAASHEHREQIKMNYFIEAFASLSIVCRHTEQESIDNLSNLFDHLYISCQQSQQTARENLASTFACLSIACKLDEEDAMEKLTSSLARLSTVCKLDEEDAVDTSARANHSITGVTDEEIRVSLPLFFEDLANIYSKMDDTESSSSDDSNSAPVDWTDDDTTLQGTPDMTEDVFIKAENYDLNDRRPSVRDARMVNSILALDEDIPMGLDESIQALIGSHAKNLIELGPVIMGVLADMRNQHAIQRATRQRLPISKRGLARKEGNTTNA